MVATLFVKQVYISLVQKFSFKNPTFLSTERDVAIIFWMLQELDVHLFVTSISQVGDMSSPLPEDCIISPRWLTFHLAGKSARHI